MAREQERPDGSVDYGNGVVGPSTADQERFSRPVSGDRNPGFYQRMLQRLGRAVPPLVGLGLAAGAVEVVMAQQVTAGTILEVAGDTLNLRADNSTDSAILVALSKGTRLTAIAAPEGDWILVRTADGKEGYVFFPYVTVLQPEAAAAPEAPTAAPGGTDIPEGASTDMPGNVRPIDTATATEAPPTWEAALSRPGILISPEPAVMEIIRSNVPLEVYTPSISAGETAFVTANGQAIAYGDALPYDRFGYRPKIALLRDTRVVRQERNGRSVEWFVYTIEAFANGTSTFMTNAFGTYVGDRIPSGITAFTKIPDTNTFTESVPIPTTSMTILELAAEVGDSPRPVGVLIYQIYGEAQFNGTNVSYPAYQLMYQKITDAFENGGAVSQTDVVYSFRPNEIFLIDTPTQK